MAAAAPALDALRATDDSSDEDEPIVVTVSSPTTSAAVSPPTIAGAAAAEAAVTAEDIKKAWMDADDEDEEDEDAAWSQLPSTPTATSAATAHPSIAVDATTASTPSAKLQSSLAALESDKWNTDAWLAVLSEAQQLPIAHAREHYEKFLAQFPTSGRWWQLYAEHELREKQYERVQEIIKKSLMQLRCPDVDLWRFYLTFTKVVQVDVAVDAQDDPQAIRAARQLMCDAFELALERVGGSLSAAPIWQSYIAFAQEDMARDPQAFLLVRKLFHRAIATPQLNMDALWREYEKFERAIPNNDALAQNFFKVFRPKLDAARAVLRDRKKLYDALALTALAVPPTRATARSDRLQMQHWQTLVAFEMANPERLDPIRLKARMRLTLEVFVGLKRHYPDAWYQYAAYESDANDRDAAIAVFERALDALPDSTFLAFALADHHELHNDVAAAKAIYERVLKDNVSALAYVTYQRFARRAFGAKGLAEARTVFKRARKDERDGACTYHVFAASALLEFYSDSSDAGKDVALKIFELGLKKCIQEPAYVQCYLDFLGHVKDDNNMRSLFEKVLAVMPVDVSRPIWDRYVAFEHTMVANGGDLATVAKIEARRAQAFPDAPFVETKGLLSIAHRYSFLDLKPPSASDQGFLDLYGASKRTGGSSALDDTSDYSGDLTHAGAGPAFVYSGPTVFPGLENTIIDVDRQVPGPPVPDFLKTFASMLPLHLQWNGPVADVDHIYRAMLLVDFPPRAQIEHSEKLLQQQQQQALQNQQNQQMQQQHATDTARNGTNHDGDGDPGVSSKRPTHDVFRSRQKQKLAKLV